MVVSPPLGARGHGPSNPRRKKMFSSHYTSVAKGGGGALLWGAKLYGRVYSITVTAVLLEYRRASGTCRYQYHRTAVPVPRTGLNLVHVLDYCTKFSTKFKIVLQSTGTQRIHVLVAEPASYAWSYSTRAVHVLDYRYCPKFSTKFKIQ